MGSAKESKKIEDGQQKIEDINKKIEQLQQELNKGGGTNK
jgi:prefoldin subunit 5